ncbi:IPP transferase [Sesbania bispinosa]|nr:IPP transferase [Sesbania bispinosa]
MAWFFYIEFTANDFRDTSSSAIDSITSREDQLPIIVGGPNSYFEALVDDDNYKFRSRYDFCCLWVDVPMPILHYYFALATILVDDKFGVRLGSLSEVTAQGDR